MVRFKAIMVLDMVGVGGGDEHPHDHIPKIYDSKFTHTVFIFFVNFILLSEVWQGTFGVGII